MKADDDNAAVGAYSAYGLEIRSSLPLPELAGGSGGQADVTITIDGNGLPDSATWPGGCRIEGGTATIGWPTAGVFQVRDGRSIQIHPAETADDKLLRLPLLGPVFAILLHQRGHLVLHASAVETAGGRSLVFMGDKGAGKSTTAAALIARGARLLADDVTAVDMMGGAPKILAGFPQIKLLEDAARSVVPGAPDLPTLHSTVDKRQHRLAEGFSLEAGRSPRFCVLERGDAFAIQPLAGAQALAALVRFSYLPRLSNTALSGESGARHLRQCAELAGRGALFRLVMPATLQEMQDALNELDHV